MGRNRRRRRLDTRDYSCESTRVSSIRLFILGALADGARCTGTSCGCSPRRSTSTSGPTSRSARSTARSSGSRRGSDRGGARRARGRLPRAQVWRSPRPGVRRWHALRYERPARDRRQARPLRPRPRPAGPRRSSTSSPTCSRAGSPSCARCSPRPRRTLETHPQYLTLAELMVMTHKTDRLAAEIAWHEELLAHLPEILADERARKDRTHDHHRLPRSAADPARRPAAHLAGARRPDPRRRPWRCSTPPSSTSRCRRSARARAPTRRPCRGSSPATRSPSASP